MVRSQVTSWYKISWILEMFLTKSAKFSSNRYRKSTCFTQLSLWPCVVQIWSRYGRKFDPTKPAHSTVRSAIRLYTSEVTVQTTDHQEGVATKKMRITSSRLLAMPVTDWRETFLVKKVQRSIVEMSPVCSWVCFEMAISRTDEVRTRCVPSSNWRL